MPAAQPARLAPQPARTGSKHARGSEDATHELSKTCTCHGHDKPAQPACDGGLPLIPGAGCWQPSQLGSSPWRRQSSHSRLKLAPVAGAAGHLPGALHAVRHLAHVLLPCHGTLRTLPAAPVSAHAAWSLLRSHLRVECALWPPPAGTLPAGGGLSQPPWCRRSWTQPQAAASWCGPCPHLHLHALPAAACLLCRAALHA